MPFSSAGFDSEMPLPKTGCLATDLTIEALKSTANGGLKV